MVGVDQALADKEKRASQRKLGEQTRRRKMEDRQQASCSTTELISSSSDTTDTSSAEDGDNLDEQCVGAVGADLTRRVKRKRGRKSVITQELAMTPDRTKVSDRRATMAITKTAKSLGQNVNELAINRSTVKRNRLECRQKRAAEIKEKCQCNVPLVVHWDGKLIKDLT